MNTMMTLTKIQRLEKTCELIYRYLAKKIRNENNAKILEKIADDEKEHYKRIKKFTKKDVKEFKFFFIFFRLLSRIFGITFGLKMIERKEEQAIKELHKLDDETFHKMGLESEDHEQELLDMIDEESLNYLGSIVLGLNDALVELSGALAGFTFAFSDTRIIAVTGLITGISASLSMASSEYLSSKAEGSEDSIKSSIYTGLAYVVTVILLIIPYLVLSNPYVALTITLLIALAIIGAFSFYMSVVKEYSFIKRFGEMAIISMGVAFFSFIIGVVINRII